MFFPKSGSQKLKAKGPLQDFLQQQPGRCESQSHIWTGQVPGVRCGTRHPALAHPARRGKIIYTAGKIYYI